jgi:hypothetical protein
MFSENRCIILDRIPELKDWVFICRQCIEEKLMFLDRIPDGDIPEGISDFVAELRVDYELEANNGAEGIGFRIFGGRWISRATFLSFAGIPEFDREFGLLDTAQEDADLPLSRGQAEFARIFRDLYQGLFERMERSGRRVVQNSDVVAALQESVTRALQQRREDRDPDD